MLEYPYDQLLEQIQAFEASEIQQKIEIDHEYIPAPKSKKFTPELTKKLSGLCNRDNIKDANQAYFCIFELPDNTRVYEWFFADAYGQSLYDYVKYCADMSQIPLGDFDINFVTNKSTELKIERHIRLKSSLNSQENQKINRFVFTIKKIRRD